MRGRNPSGPEFVAKLQGSEKAKQRARVLLETLSGKCRVLEACDKLGIKEARFDQVRIEALQALVTSLEEKPVGRPARPATPAEEENRQLREQIVELQGQLQATLVRAEMAVILPQVGASAEKKTTASRPASHPRQGRPPQPKRSS